MAASRSRRRDDDDYDDDDDDRPRRRRRDYDDDCDDPPRSRRRRDDADDDYDDRPRRRRRGDYDDEPRRRPRRKSSKSNTGLIVGIVVGILAVVGVVVAIVLITGAGGANISYAKFKDIRAGATIESLEKQFGKATRLERSEWSKVYYAKNADDAGVGRPGRGGPNATLADLESFGTRIDAWYHWHRGSEDIYVAAGTDFNGQPGLIMKVYTNSNALGENRRAGGDIKKMVPSYEVQPIN